MDWSRIAWALSAFLLCALPLLLAHRRPDWIVRRYVVVLGVTSALSLFAAFALVSLQPLSLRMGLDPSEEPMLPAGDPAQDVYRGAVLNFGDDDLYVLAMRTPNLFDEQALLAMRGLGEDVRRIPGVRRAQSLVDTTKYRYVSGTDTVQVEQLIDDIPRDPHALEQLGRDTVGDSLYRGSLVSRDGRTGALNISFRSMTDGEFVSAGIDERIAALVRRYSGPNAEFFATGRQHIKARAHRIMVDDLRLLIPLAVLVGAAIGWTFAGALLSGVLPVVTSLVATLWVFGGLAWHEQSLNLITIILGPTLICVGSVYGVHVMSVHRDLLQAGITPHEAAVECIRRTWEPVLIAGATTCVGFAALCLSDTPAVQQLGGFCALGVGFVTMLSLVGLPALLGALPASALQVREGRPAALVADLLERIVRLVQIRTQPVLVGWGAVTVLALLCLPRIVVDSDYLTFFDERSDVRRDFDVISRELVGAVPLYVTVDGGEEGAFREPENLLLLESLQHRIEVLANVDSATSMVDLVRRANRVLEKDDPAAERIPNTRGEVADVLFLIPKSDLRRFANSNHSRANIVVRTSGSGSATILGLEREIRGLLETTEWPPGLHAEVTGNSILVNHGAEGIARNQFSTVAAATLAIFLIVARAFRSVRVGLLAMIPNLVPVVVFFGVLGGGAATLSLPTSLISCIALGIAIDDTAHFLVGYRRFRAEGKTPDEAAARCIRTLGRPIVTTSLMLIGGFLVLSFSGFATLRQFGHLTALTMFVCLCADLVLLPAILIRARV